MFKSPISNFKETLFGIPLNLLLEVGPASFKLPECMNLSLSLSIYIYIYTCVNMLSYHIICLYYVIVCYVIL